MTTFKFKWVVYVTLTGYCGPLKCAAEISTGIVNGGRAVPTALTPTGSVPTGPGDQYSSGPPRHVGGGGGH
jgi:hypothetical protein